MQAAARQTSTIPQDTGTSRTVISGSDAEQSAEHEKVPLTPELAISSQDTPAAAEGTAGNRVESGQQPTSVPSEGTGEAAAAEAESTPAGIVFEQDSTGDSPVEMVARVLFGQILLMPGVVSVSIFNQGLAVLTMGEVNMEDISVLAEDLLSQALHIAKTMHMGDFIQMTLQIPGGNVIIAPFHNEYLCILTTPEINLAQIRRLLRDIQRGQCGLPL